MDKPQKHRQTNKNRQVELNQIEKFLHSKQFVDGRNNFAVFKQQQNNNNHNLILRWTHDLNRLLSEGEIQVTMIYVKKLFSMNNPLRKGKSKLNKHLTHQKDFSQ